MLIGRMRIPGWALGALTGLLAVALGAAIEGAFIHPWHETLQNIAVKAMIQVPIFALIYHFLLRKRFDT